MNKGIIMEVKKNCAIVLNDDGVMYKIKLKKDMTAGKKIYFFEEDILNNTVNNVHRNNSFVKAFGSIAALFLIVFTFFHVMKPQEAFAVVSLDINPSIQIEVDSNQKIIKVDGINADGKNIDFSDIKDVSFEIGIQQIKDKLNKYLDTNKDVLVGYAFVKNGDNSSYEENLKGAIDSTFTTEQVTYLTGDKEDVDEAKTKGLSLGRYEASKVVDQDIKNNIDKAPVKEITANIKDNEDSTQWNNAKDEKENLAPAVDTKPEAKADKNSTEKPSTSAASDNTQAGTDPGKDKATGSKAEKNNDVLDVQPDVPTQNNSNGSTSTTNPSKDSDSSKDNDSVSVIPNNGSVPSSGGTSTNGTTSSNEGTSTKGKDDAGKTTTVDIPKSTDNLGDKGAKN